MSSISTVLLLVACGSQGTAPVTDGRSDLPTLGSLDACGMPLPANAAHDRSIAAESPGGPITLQVPLIGRASTYRFLATVNESPSMFLTESDFDLDRVTGAATWIGPTDLVAPLEIVADPRRGRDRIWVADASFGSLSTLRELDVEAGTSVEIGPVQIANAVYGMAYDAERDRLFATARFTGDLWEVDPETAASTLIGSPGVGSFFALLLDDEQRLFAVDNATQSLWQLDLETAKPTLVGGTGLTGIVELAQDPDTGLVYLSDTATDSIYTIDLDTARVTLVGPYGAGLNYLVGMTFAPTDSTPYVLDFSFEDDFESALADGQSIQSGSEFGNLVTISGSGANLGAAIFDSDPAGPNAGGSDPDLLVDQGNLLILQDSSTPMQSSDGVFDTPNDARDGGTLVFDFSSPSNLRSIDLVDVCPGPQDAFLTLADGASRVRIYLVPNGWTSDVADLGPPGVGRLDLTTLVPQPGYLSTATAYEDPGFDAMDVRELRVTLMSSGAVDNLVFLPLLEERVGGE